MRKVSLQQFAVSLDGYICEEGTEFHRLWEGVFDDEFDQYFVTRLRRAGTHIMGRTTYLAMGEYWPKADVYEAEIAAIMNDIPKVVFSKTLQSADWPDARIARGDTADEIARLKQEQAARSSLMAAQNSSGPSPGLNWWMSTAFM
jgi:dihydrofolate reductase